MILRQKTRVEKFSEPRKDRGRQPPSVKRASTLQVPANVRVRYLNRWFENVGYPVSSLLAREKGSDVFFTLLK